MHTTVRAGRGGALVIDDSEGFYLMRDGVEEGTTATVHAFSSVVGHGCGDTCGVFGLALIVGLVLGRTGVSGVAFSPSISTASKGTGAAGAIGAAAAVSGAGAAGDAGVASASRAATARGASASRGRS